MFILKVILSKSTSKNRLVSFIAHSNIDPEREGARRNLFNQERDGWDVKESNRYLSVTGGKPLNNELIHLILSPGASTYDSLGRNPAERVKAFEEVVKAILAALQTEIRAKHLK
jgi:hypothetical protein